MPALVNIIAKILILVDQALDSFVTITPGAPDCGVYPLTGTLSACGVALADAIETLITAGTNLGVYLMAGLGVVNAG
jgi:hypothetical protein